MLFIKISLIISSPYSLDFCKFWKLFNGFYLENETNSKIVLMVLHYNLYYFE